jgi:glycosyltransferase involved in cell wall biosynthesis
MKNKPLVTFCILTYNQENYIEEAIQSAYNQNYSPLEIIISDDGSKDRTRGIISDLVKNYKGDHNVIINFNKDNLGLSSHFSKVCMEIAQGDLVILAAGDDISLPDRTMRSVEFMQNHPECYIADFNVDYIDEQNRIESGILKKSDIRYVLSDLLGNNIRGVRGCSRVYRKELFTRFGPLNPLCPTEDSPSVWRALMLGEVWVLKEKMVLYRRHSSSISSPLNMVKLNIKDIVAQYNKDIQSAFTQGIINQNEKFSLILLSRKVYKRRQFEKYKKIMINFLKSITNRLKLNSIYSKG